LVTLTEKKMKNFALLLVGTCFVAGCPGKDPVAADASASAVVTASAAPSAAPSAVETAAPAVTASASVEAAAAKK
jgi:PBP1b-binding outer membrane lipoprotein LpoB